jgi:hypothetical protein
LAMEKEANNTRSTHQLQKWVIRSLIHSMASNAYLILDDISIIISTNPNYNIHCILQTMWIWTMMNLCWWVCVYVNFYYMSLLSFNSFLLETKLCPTFQTRFGGMNGHII